MIAGCLASRATDFTFSAGGRVAHIACAAFGAGRWTSHAGKALGVTVATGVETIWVSTIIHSCPATIIGVVGKI